MIKLGRAVLDKTSVSVMRWPVLLICFMISTSYDM